MEYQTADKRQAERRSEIPDILCCVHSRKKSINILHCRDWKLLLSLLFLWVHDYGAESAGHVCRELLHSFLFR